MVDCCEIMAYSSITMIAMDNNLINVVAANETSLPMLRLGDSRRALSALSAGFAGSGLTNDRGISIVSSGGSA